MEALSLREGSGPTPGGGCEEREKGEKVVWPKGHPAHRDGGRAEGTAPLMACASAVAPWSPIPFVLKLEYVRGTSVCVGGVC